MTAGLPPRAPSGCGLRQVRTPPAGGYGRAAAADAPPVFPVSEKPIELASVEVSARPPTRTSMAREWLYGISSGSAVLKRHDSVEAMEDDPAAMELAAELGIIATPSAVDLAKVTAAGIAWFPTRK